MTAADLQLTGQTLISGAAAAMVAALAGYVPIDGVAVFGIRATFHAPPTQ